MSLRHIFGPYACGLFVTEESYNDEENKKRLIRAFIKVYEKWVEKNGPNKEWEPHVENFKRKNEFIHKEN